MAIRVGVAVDEAALFHAGKALEEGPEALQAVPAGDLCDDGTVEEAQIFRPGGGGEGPVPLQAHGGGGVVVVHRGVGGLHQLRSSQDVRQFTDREIAIFRTERIDGRVDDGGTVLQKFRHVVVQGKDRRVVRLRPRLQEIPGRVCGVIRFVEADVTAPESGQSILLLKERPSPERLWVMHGENVVRLHVTLQTGGTLFAHAAVEGPIFVAHVRGARPVEEVVDALREREKALFLTDDYGPLGGDAELAEHRNHLGQHLRDAAALCRRVHHPDGSVAQLVGGLFGDSTEVFDGAGERRVVGVVVERGVCLDIDNRNHRRRGNRGGSWRGTSGIPESHLFSAAALMLNEKRTGIKSAGSDTECSPRTR